MADAIVGNYPDGDLRPIESGAGSRAAIPISQYAEQYGPNGVAVSPNAITFNVTLPGTTYNDAMLKSWVNQISSEQGLPTTACVAVLNPQGIDNTSGLRSHGIGGYHSRANLPYVFANVSGKTSLSLTATGSTLATSATRSPRCWSIPTPTCPTPKFAIPVGPTAPRPNVPPAHRDNGVPLTLDGEQDAREEDGPVE